MGVSAPKLAEHPTGVFLASRPHTILPLPSLLTCAHSQIGDVISFPSGQGTIGMEILKQLADVDVVYVCVGGGGMLAGIAGYIKGLRPEIKLIGVEAEDAAGMTVRRKINILLK